MGAKKLNGALPLDMHMSQEIRTICQPASETWIMNVLHIFFNNLFEEHMFPGSLAEGRLWLVQKGQNFEWCKHKPSYVCKVCCYWCTSSGWITRLLGSLGELADRHHACITCPGITTLGPTKGFFGLLLVDWAELVTWRKKQGEQRQHGSDGGDGDDTGWYQP